MVELLRPLMEIAKVPLVFRRPVAVASSLVGGCLYSPIRGDRDDGGDCVHRRPDRRCRRRLLLHNRPPPFGSSCKIAAALIADQLLFPHQNW